MKLVVTTSSGIVETYQIPSSLTDAAYALGKGDISRTIDHLVKKPGMDRRFCEIVFEQIRSECASLCSTKVVSSFRNTSKEALQVK